MKSKKKKEKRGQKKSVDPAAKLTLLIGVIQIVLAIIQILIDL